MIFSQFVRVMDIGWKDIMWFHTVIWPIILMAIDEPLPKSVYVHGFINDSSGEKMSKTKGNVIDPITLLDSYGVDPLRFYLLRTVSSGEDGNFSEDELISFYNQELGNDLGNLLMRITKMINSKFSSEITSFKGTSQDNLELQNSAEKFINELDELFSKFEYTKALDQIWARVREINQYLNKTEPWKIKDDNTKLKNVLYHALENFVFCSVLLKPFIPGTSEKILSSLGISDKIKLIQDFKFGSNSYNITIADALFPKIETKPNSQETKMDNDKKQDTSNTVEVLTGFDALDIRVGKIIEVENHPDADKLYVMKVTFGTEERQIVAGLKPYYSKEDLLGKITTFVFNLEFAKLRGVESQGMVLIAETEDEKYLAFVEFGSSPKDKIQSDELIGKQLSLDNSESVFEKPKISYKIFSKVKLSVENGAIKHNDKELFVGDLKLFAPSIDKGYLC